MAARQHKRVILTGKRLRDEFTCPISYELLRDPVIAADGHTYDRSSIERWLMNHNTSPKTNAPLEHKQLIPNTNLARLIKDLVDEGGASLYVKDEDNHAHRRIELWREPVITFKCLGPPESSWFQRSFLVRRNGSIAGRKEPDNRTRQGRDFIMFADSTVSRKHFAVALRSRKEFTHPCFKTTTAGESSSSSSSSSSSRSSGDDGDSTPTGGDGAVDGAAGDNDNFLRRGGAAAAKELSAEEIAEALVPEAEEAIDADSGVYTIQDLGSAGGTFVRLMPSRALPLLPGIMILIGKHQFVVSEAGDSDPEVTTTPRAQEEGGAHDQAQPHPQQQGVDDRAMDKCTEEPNTAAAVDDQDSDGRAIRRMNTVRGSGAGPPSPPPGHNEDMMDRRSPFFVESGDSDERSDTRGGTGAKADDDRDDVIGGDERGGPLAHVVQQLGRARRDTTDNDFVRAMDAGSPPVAVDAVLDARDRTMDEEDDSDSSAAAAARRDANDRFRHLHMASAKPSAEDESSATMPPGSALHGRDRGGRPSRQSRLQIVEQAEQLLQQLSQAGDGGGDDPDTGPDSGGAASDAEIRSRLAKLQEDFSRMHLSYSRQGGDGEAPDSAGYLRNHPGAPPGTAPDYSADAKSHDDGLQGDEDVSDSGAVAGDGGREGLFKLERSSAAVAAAATAAAAEAAAASMAAHHPISAAQAKPMEAPTDDDRTPALTAKRTAAYRGTDDDDEKNSTGGEGGRGAAAGGRRGGGARGGVEAAAARAATMSFDRGQLCFDTLPWWWWGEWGTNGNILMPAVNDIQGEQEGDTDDEAGDEDENAEAVNVAPGRRRSAPFRSKAASRLGVRGHRHVSLTCFGPEGTPIQGQSYHIGPEGATLGRKQSNSINFSAVISGKTYGIDSSVSGEHARVIYDRHFGGLVVVDGSPTRPSTNGTWFRLSKSHEESFMHPLRDNMEVLIGTVRFRVHIDVTLSERELEEDEDTDPELDDDDDDGDGAKRTQGSRGGR